ncbi:methyltetrahydrofolate cobalamin methyltransferase [Thermatribacter velox]|uniref:Methyltetrahydrofolate cobalamin methyltransferase n=1 Tax=Thermatribacter velox TaxID=3039681 RepID=A0ABZ2YFX9_9BACT
MLIIIGERINATRKPIREALERRDAQFFIEEARKQEQAGAHFIDVNAGTDAKSEMENLPWLVEIIQDEVSVPLCFDSANEKALERALKVYKKKELIINSFTAEEAKIKALLPLAKEWNASIVGLAMGEAGIPQTGQERMKLVDRLLEAVHRYDIPEERLFIDPLVIPVGTDSTQGKVFLETLRSIKDKFPKVKTVCGLSNVSFGLPNRRLLNRTFVVLCLGFGLDAAIIDPLDRELMASIYAAEALLGIDEFCMKYLSAFREGRLNT